MLFLKEKIRLFQWLCFLVAFFGVILLKGFDVSLKSYGLALILGSAFFGGLVYIVIRKIGHQDHPLVIVNYFMLISAIFGAVFAIPNWRHPEGIEWFPLLGMGIFGFFGQYYMTKAFQIAETNLIAPLKYLEVVFSILLGVVWFSETYSFISFVAIALIISALIGNISGSKPLNKRL